MKELYLTISVILGIIPQLMVMRGIYRKTMKLSFSTYFIWFVLNLIICTALIIESGNYFLSLAYTILNLIISVMIFRSEKSIIFQGWEKVAVVLSFACMIIWYFTNGVYAVIATSIASVIAGLPQLLVVYKHPKLTSPTVWMLGTLAPLFSVLGAANWSVVQRFYPMSFLVYGIVGLSLLFIRK